MRLLLAIGRFWYDFVIGDDWKIAAFVTAVLAAVAGLAVADVMDGKVLAVVGAALLMAGFAAGVVWDARRTR